MKNTTNVRIPKKECFKKSLETVDRRKTKHECQVGASSTETDQLSQKYDRPMSSRKYQALQGDLAYQISTNSNNPVYVLTNHKYI